ncbi:MAG: homogentisate 1,2-dioxygenase [Methylocystis sp.]|uniref:homogentisate 1,2-dioxygenase n=1 Tax=Methylocystis sp. TaxID=1911079 RepID=UPI003D0E2442
MTPTRYLHGFGNEFESEALPNALPIGQNSPQRCPYGLYAEQLSGSAFTAPNHLNRRSWLYRIRPSVLHVRDPKDVGQSRWKTAPCRDVDAPLGQLRWSASEVAGEAGSFVDGMRTIATAGDCGLRVGMAAHLYLAAQSMRDDYFYNADGELLIVPQLGDLRILTEFGLIECAPGEICVIPRGVKFRVELPEGRARGYVCENYGAPFTLPSRGVIGANGLANPRDFHTPTAAFEDTAQPCRLTVKWGGRFYRCEIGHSPLDVVAWHGDYAPYKYDLRKFCPVGALLFDHPDPSIFTVLTSPSDESGVGNVDFAIFPPRWQVAEHTFRPPWFHLNVMSEFMGLIYGRYDAKPSGFEPGGMSLHNAMLPHGPDAEAFQQAFRAELSPDKIDGALAFMFESRLPLYPTSFALSLETLQKDYADCWSGLRRYFTGDAP